MNLYPTAMRVEGEEETGVVIDELRIEYEGWSVEPEEGGT